MGAFVVGQSSLSGRDDDVHGGMVAAMQVVGLSSGPNDAGGGMVAALLTQAVVVVSAIAGNHRRRVGVGCRHCHRRCPWWGCRRCH